MSDITPERIEQFFTRSNGDYVFARWGRPVAPVVFGVEEETLVTVKSAIEACVAIAGHRIEEMDPELGTNLMVFFLSDWAELLDVPHMGDLIPELESRVATLQDRNAHQYRAFRFDDAGAIKACFSFVRMGGAMDEVPAEVIALSQAVQAMLLWSDKEFTQDSPLAQTVEGTVVRPDVANVLRAAYDPVLPDAARDAAHALRLYARVVAG
ncbi:hypothetical protein Q4560_10555 [Celeribacter halophilus]|jgi:hypothetical protein|uniref:Uncharacterized protein n=1 Tax=Celeribacter halophilus TaxID=576117 RepID=A0AAW7XW33_9RHOB|nr:hypothetical protein [Celeribacter halophilus]MBU2890181.1 hypothetical protein [Celeribacter halophilus]MDO6457209.1 hypothetical protein [Celeribacter halophilus]MDO6509926.1 hypothetical protein [Celeribacter halophilus]MDO6723701.1 hypothetical protein [Celeribacter halophilus]